MKTIASIAAVTIAVVGISLSAGHPTAHRPAYDYGLTGNDWWAAQQRVASQATDHAAPAAAR